MKGSTTRVAWRLMRQDPLSFVYSWSLWVAFHLSPLPVGWVLKAVLDHVTHGRTSVPWALLAGLLGLELSRWVVFATAAVQWHGAWVGWQTAPRVTILRSLVSGSGPAAGRLPGSPGEAVSRFRDDVQDLALVLDVWLDISGAVLSASAALIVVAFIAPAAALAVAVPVAIALAFSWWLGPRLRAWRSPGCRSGPGGWARTCARPTSRSTG